MYNNEVFVIDLTGCTGTGEIINSISLALEIPNAQGAKISLKFKDVILNQAQLMSIQSLISSHNSSLYVVETTNGQMRENCETMGLRVNFVNDIQIDETKIVIEEFKSPVMASPEEFYVKASERNENENFISERVEQKVESCVKVGEQITEPYVKKEDFFFEDEVKEADLPDGDVNIEQAIHQSAKIAFENATNFSFTQEIIEENRIKEETMDVYKKAEVEEKETYEEVDYYAPPTDEPVVINSEQTIYVTQTLRSGQVLEYDGNIVIIGDCHPGSEIKAGGDITVWGVLGSIAHAGTSGSRDAKIRALKMNAVQLRIADCYSRRPDGTNIPYIIKSSTFTPEEARVVDNSIVLYKI